MENLTVGDVMTTEVVTVREEAPFKELVRLMKTHNISGLPVVNGSQRLVGIVTEADLLVVMGGASGIRKRHIQFGRLLERLHSPSKGTEMDASTAHTAAQVIMTKDVVTAQASTPLREAARKIMHQGIKRFPVVDPEGRVVGIVSRQDLLRPYLQDDEHIREEVMENLAKRILWIDPATIKVVVDQGVVKLHGVIAQKSQKDVLVEFTRRLDGVVAVEDHMTAVDNDRDYEPDWARHESSRAEPWGKVARIYGYTEEKE
jgi:CBS domain-containing protein